MDPKIELQDWQARLLPSSPISNLRHAGLAILAVDA